MHKFELAEKPKELEEDIYFCDDKTTEDDVFYVTEDDND